jgi:hypothetical protein
VAIKAYFLFIHIAKTVLSFAMHYKWSGHQPDCIAIRTCTVLLLASALSVLLGAFSKSVRFISIIMIQLLYFMDTVKAFYCGLFKDAVSTTDHTALQNIVIDELGRIWKE